jgi:hypothetical protein
MWDEAGAIRCVTRTDFTIVLGRFDPTIGMHLLDGRCRAFTESALLISLKIEICFLPSHQHQFL